MERRIPARHQTCSPGQRTTVSRFRIKTAAFMFQELKFQLSTAILTILTLAAGVSAFINLEQQYHYRLPDDGVIWVDRSGGVQALHVPAGSPGATAGIHSGDWLTQINNVEIENALDVPKALAAIGAW